MEDTSGQRVLETRILTNLRERFGDFWRNREMQLYQLRVVVHPIGTLRGHGRKLRRVIDERQMSSHPSVQPV
jgi:hypothetical protein